MGALKPLAYMRYMCILFLIATSRTDYDTLRDLYARSHHIRTHTPIPLKAGFKPDCATFRRKHEAIRILFPITEALDPAGD